MKNRIKRSTSIIAAAILVLTGCFTLPTRYGNVTPSARAAASDLALPALQSEQAVQQLKQQGLYDSLAEALAAARYELRWEDQPAPKHLPAAYHAPNPAQRMSAYFTPDGLHLMPRNKGNKNAEAGTRDSEHSEQAEWQATMKLVGYGYEDNLWLMEAAEIAARGNRIEYRHQWPPMTEWYINKASGLEQGFTLAAPPAVRGEGDRLRVALELTGDLRPEIEEDGLAIALKQENGEVALRYSKLFATDAEGRELPSQMKLSEGRVILEVNDKDAIYPLTIDPIFTQQAQLTDASGAAFDLFGSSVAIYWDTVVVGVPFGNVTINGNNSIDQGSAFVFVRSNGVWNLQARLTASNGTSGDNFGTSVAINYDTIVVGANQSGRAAESGAAYVFVRNGTTWSQQAQLFASSRAAGDQFGISVAISRDYTVAVGAPGQDVSGNNQGATFVFVRDNNNVWMEQARLIAGDRANWDQFGASVAINENDGSRVVVGAPLDDIVAGNITKTDQGSAYVFRRSNGLWSQEAKLMAGDGETNDAFGASVSITGTASRVAVGSPFDDIVANNVNKADQGSAYVFTRSNTFWSQEVKLTASDGMAGDKFGHSISISGYQVLVGAPFDDIVVNGSSVADQGSAYAYIHSNSAWSLLGKLTAGNGAMNDNFGSSVAIYSGTTSTFVVGAPKDDVTTNNATRADQGSAYVFIH